LGRRQISLTKKLLLLRKNALIQVLKIKVIWGLGLLLVLSSCDPEEKKEETKLIQFEYFEKNSAIERYIQWSNDAVYITLPSCFIKENYYDFSLTNEQNFRCNKTHSFFSIDRIDKEDMDSYKTFFEVEDSTKTYSDQEIILDYIKDTRLSNIVGSSHSLQSTIQTHKQKDVLLVSVKGRSDNYQNDLFYQFGAIEFDGVTYLIQFIVNEEDVYYYHEDIIQIFKSIRHA
jgi:hypothetical protein